MDLPARRLEPQPLRQRRGGEVCHPPAIRLEYLPLRQCRGRVRLVKDIVNVAITFVIVWLLKSELTFKSVHNLTLRPQHTPQKDNLMVLAFFFEKIVSGCQTVNITDTNQYENESNVLYNGQNMSMFDAIRTYRHTVNPMLDAKNGVWSNMEWDNLLHYKIMQNLTTLPDIQTPLKLSEGGLGWYDNNDFDVRKRQGILASHYGVDGFIFYATINQTSPITTRSVVNARVQDGEPAGWFAIMIVDEPDRVGTDNLVAFGQWLRNITSHSDYIRVDGRPVVYIYKLDLFLADGDTVVRPKSIRRAFSIVEKSFGSPLYWIGTDSNYCLSGIRQKKALYKEFDAWIDFAPHRGPCMTAKPLRVSPQIHTFHETFLSGWFPAPRGLAWFATKHKAGWQENGSFAPSDVKQELKKNGYFATSGCDPKNSPERFYEIMKQGLIRARCREEGNKTLIDGQLWKPVTIFAWNEWGEQAVLEPSTLNRFSYLESLHQARHDAMQMNCST